MGNKTIYVKDEALWKRARDIAGKAGLSAFIEEAVEEFVERKELENRGFSPQRIYVQGDAFPEGQLVRFNGRRLGDTLLGGEPEQPYEIAEVFQTKGGKLVLVLRNADTNEAYEYRTYDSLEELRAEQDIFSAIPPGTREEFLESLADALGQKWSKWID